MKFGYLVYISVLSVCCFPCGETGACLYWPVSVAEAASWGNTAGRYVSAEPWAFCPVVDLGDAYGGRKGTWGDLAHHWCPQALLVTAAYWWALEAVKKKIKKITQIHRLHENVIIGYTHSWKFKQTADHFQGNANIGATHITADMKSRFMDSLMYRKQPLTLIIKSSLQVFILE